MKKPASFQIATIVTAESAVSGEPSQGAVQALGIVDWLQKPVDVSRLKRALAQVVLDCLAAAIAARQWEPVTNHRVAALRLWARGWLLARGPQEDDDAPPAADGDAPAADGTAGTG